jgi:tetratricopeptide (TPR) repeat protein
VILERAGVTDFDRVAGEIKIAALVTRWPFTPESGRSRFLPATPADSVTYDLLRRNIPWSEARYRLSEFYATREEYHLARGECAAVAHALPFSPEPLLRLADLYRREGRADDAFATYRRSIEREETPQARMNMAVILLGANLPQQAAVEMQKAFDVARTSGPALPPDVAAAGHFLLANVHLRAGRHAEAKGELEQALALRPSYPEARQLLDALRRL